MGTPVATCHEGFGVGAQAVTVVPVESSVGLPQVLGPPLPPEMEPPVMVKRFSPYWLSFQACSGIGVFSEPFLLSLVLFQ